MQKTLLLNCVGLTPAHLGEDTPALAALAKQGFSSSMKGITPGVTCSAQSTMLTGLAPRDHGIVGNGWYFRDLAEVGLWRQSNHLVKGEKLWDTARKRDKSFTVCNMFWWYNMYANVDSSLTPRPLYFADGLKLPGIYGSPPDFRRQFEVGYPPFPLFNFWGPAADIRSSNWIAQASIKAMKSEDPTLLMVYIPHLDYNLQRLGPNDPATREDLRQLDQCVAPLIEAAQTTDRKIIVVSEYGITEVSSAIHINRILREAGFLATQPQLDRENIDPGASEAFAVADHQIAHVYVRDADKIADVKKLLESVDGIEGVFDRHDQGALGLDHQRSGELVCISEGDRWFSYYFWFDDAMAPDYARAVDIHRKPGYDPVELFADPTISMLKAKIGMKVLKKKLGFRMLMDVIPLDSSLVRGSHGRLADHEKDGPILIMPSDPKKEEDWTMSDVKDLVLDQIFGGHQ
ncbi:MAG: putative AlkP superfamily pyrophosphatase or phosphodiesterase [Planctomycetota bacterium]|jgi:predicted AlkP superfamily pyrophosphatase or phosphodiesterase